MFEKIQKILKNKEIRKKLIEILLLLIVFRILSHIPIPGINLSNLKTLFEQSQLLGVLNMLSGSGLKNFSIVALGVGPYITASIIVQLLSIIIPSLERMTEEGEQGYKKMEQITRILTVPFAILQGYATLVLLRTSGYKVISDYSFSSIISMLIILTAGTMITVWIGEIISEKKIGNGMSWIIFAGIIASFLSTISRFIITFDPSQAMNALLYLALGIALIFFVVYVTEAQRNIPIIYARQYKDGKSFGNNMSYLPIRVNQVGMVPIIFAASVAVIPNILLQYLSKSNHASGISNILYKGAVFLSGDIAYSVFYFLLIILFTYFYTSIIFKADKVAENLNKQGAYIPGVRPGKETEDYLNNISNKLVFAGSMFLALVAIVPNIMSKIFGISSIMSGSSLLIVVGVVIETVKELEAYAMQNDYEDKYADYSFIKKQNNKEVGF
ncbi:preprotein translocase subunit SecY [Patescibacteria group bacterium]|nr:preprotein translocase subunit SecY [Patescibacteria group bacterium]HOC96181.1 preprotein translocase subunit SecY [bacterium]